MELPSHISKPVIFVINIFLIEHLFNHSLIIYTNLNIFKGYMTRPLPSLNKFYKFKVIKIFNSIKYLMPSNVLTWSPILYYRNILLAYEKQLNWMKHLTSYIATFHHPLYVIATTIYVFIQYFDSKANTVHFYPF